MASSDQHQLPTAARLRGSSTRLLTVVAFVQELVKKDVPIAKLECVTSALQWSSGLIKTASEIYIPSAIGEEIVKRSALVEETALLLHFDLEEWGTVDPLKRLEKIHWHTSIVQSRLDWLFHRACKLSKALGKPYQPQKTSQLPGNEAALIFDPSFPIKDPFMQSLWKDFFTDSFRVISIRDLFSALQNELRVAAEPLLTHTDIRFLSNVIGSKGDVVSPEEINRFLQYFAPKQATGGLAKHKIFVAALKRARENVKQLDDGTVHAWFQPTINYSSAFALLSNSIPYTFVIRLSSQTGCFVINWVAASRQIKSAKLFTTESGFAWRDVRYRASFPTLPDILHEYRDIFRQPLTLPPQIPPEGFLPPLPDED